MKITEGYELGLDEMTTLNRAPQPTTTYAASIGLIKRPVQDAVKKIAKELFEGSIKMSPIAQKETEMSTEKMIPISYVKKFTPLVVDDDLISSAGVKYKVTSETLDHWNEIDNQDDKWFVVSFADRPNTGKQPVGDDVVVDRTTPTGERTCIASHEHYCHDWRIDEDDSTGNILSWKPNHAAMLKQWQAEQLEAVASDRLANLNEDKLMSHADMVAKFETPVFTQAMADAGELLTVGMLFTTETDNNYTVDAINAKSICFTDEDGFFVGIPTGMVKPVQTDDERIRDAIKLIIGRHVCFAAIGANEDILSALLASDKFTITLKANPSA